MQIKNYFKTFQHRKLPNFKLGIFLTVVLVQSIVNAPVHAIEKPGTAISNASASGQVSVNKTNENVAPQAPSIDPNQVSALDKKLDKLSADLGKEIASSRSTWWEKLLPAGIGIAGIMIGSALSGWFGHRSQTRQINAADASLKRQLEASRKSLDAQLRASKTALSVQLSSAQKSQRVAAKNDVFTRVMEFRSKQLNEFYAPIQFMLVGSSVVRQQLCEMLLESANGRDRFEFKTESDGRPHLWVRASKTEGARPFRLIHHMFDLATNYPVVMPLVGEIVSIGEQISNLIYEKGGFAKVKNTRLAENLGTYLGHYSILKDAYSTALRDPQLLTTIRYTIAYPRDLDELLRTDAVALANEITNWGDGAAVLRTSASN